MMDDPFVDGAARTMRIMAHWIAIFSLIALLIFSYYLALTV